MPIKSIERLKNDSGADIGIRLNGVSGANRDGIVQVFYDKVPGGPWNTQRLTAFIILMQLAIDYRTPRSRPNFVDDPDALVDPGRPDFFHDGSDLVARAVVISDATWEGDHVSFTVSRA